VLGGLRSWRASGKSGGSASPSLYEVVVSSINIMQVRIASARMAGDPPDLLVTPRLSDFAWLDFDRAGEAVDEGRRAAARALAGLDGAPEPEPNPSRVPACGPLGRRGPHPEIQPFRCAARARRFSRSRSISRISRGGSSRVAGP
jgi:hypothetical protein